jgi:hypothetical protein
VNNWPPAYLTPVDQESIDRGDGEYAIEFAESFGSIGKDGVAGRAGDALNLRPWQRELVKCVYAKDADGGLKFRTPNRDAQKERKVSLVICCLWSLLFDS